MDIYANIKNGDYETKLPCPKRPDKKCHVCSNGIANINNLKENIVSFCSKCGAAVKDEYESRLKTYQRELSEYKDDTRRLNNMFKTDALTHCGIGNHKKSNIAWQIAMNERDNNQNIVEFLEELAELMVD